MKKIILVFTIALFGFCKQSSAQIDLNNLDLKDIIGKVMRVEHGFSPKFFLGNTKIPKIPKVAEILGMKKNANVIKLFNTFRTGRTIFHLTSYAGSAIALYAVIKKAGSSTSAADNGALIGGLTSAATGVIVKLLTKGAAYKAVDLFNGIAMKKIRDIFSIAPASKTLGVGLYVKLD